MPSHTSLRIKDKSKFFRFILILILITLSIFLFFKFRNSHDSVSPDDSVLVSSQPPEAPKEDIKIKFAVIRRYYVS